LSRLSGQGYPRCEFWYQTRKAWSATLIATSFVESGLEDVTERRSVCQTTLPSQFDRRSIDHTSELTAKENRIITRVLRKLQSLISTSLR
jgi:hypothetical protein